MAVIVCPTCTTRYRVSDSQLTKASKLRCKKCQTVFVLRDHLESESVSPPSIDDVKPSSFPQQTATSPQVSSSEEPKLDLSHIQFSAETPQEEAPTPSSQEGDLSLDMNLNDMTLDFDSSPAPSPEPSSNSLDFSFESTLPEEPEADEDDDMQDHLQMPAQPEKNKADLTLDAFSFQDGGPEDEGEGNALDLDFSFSASVPEPEGDEDDEDYEEEDYEEDYEGEDDVAEDFSLGGLELGLAQSEPEASADSQTVTASFGGETLTDFSTSEEYSEDGQFEEDAYPEEDLPACCVDSLAMGLRKCELCGRDLSGKDPAIAKSLQDQRRQELKEELLPGEVQIGFSDEASGYPGARGGTPSEDFSDVEQALDALASGDFQETVKKKDSKKQIAQRKQKLLGALVAVLVIVVAAIWLLLPSGHEKLLARYDKLMAQADPSVYNIATLFLDVLSQKDQDLFKRLSIMTKMPEVDSGIILGVQEDSEETVLDNFEQQMSTLREEIAVLEKELDEKTAALKKYTAMDVSSSIVKSSITALERRFGALQAEFEGKRLDASRKLIQAKQELEEAQQQLEESKKNAQKYVDATDPHLKAIYVASVRNQKTLAEKIAKLQINIREMEPDVQLRVQELEIEYTPKFDEIQQEIDQQTSLYELALKLENEEISPITLLTKDVEQVSNVIKEKKNELQEIGNISNNILIYFRKAEQTQRIQQEKANIIFTHITKNATASIELGSAKQQISIVLGRYQAAIGDEIFLSRWLVEDTL